MVQDVMITGISKGLGKFLFQGLIPLQQVHCIGIGRNFSKENNGKHTTLIPCDLSKPETLPCIEHIVSKGRGLIFINNAGTVEPIGSIGALPEQALQRAVQVNFLSPMLLCNQLVQFCHKNRQRLKIINISTGAANYPIVGWGAYCSTKAAFKMFLDVLAQQEKDGGLVEVIHIDPGVMDTGMQEKIRAANADDFPRVAEFQAFKAQGKLRKPEEVAESIIREHIL